jgi:RHS repeat-associated protein
LYNYDAFGNALDFDPSTAQTEFLYSGEQFDPKINQQYLRQRYYDPTTGRFNRLDPFFGKTSDPLSLHKYTYANGDPANGIDPTGNMSVMGCIGAISIGMSVTAATLPVAGAAWLSVTGKISPYALVEKLISPHTWTAAVGSLIGGALTSVTFQTIAIRVGEKMSGKILPFVSLFCSITGVIESAKLTWEMVSGEMPREDAEEYVASMIVTNFLVYAIGKKLNKIKQGGTTANDADYWNLSPADRTKYENGQLMLSNKAWGKLQEDAHLFSLPITGQNTASVVARGGYLTKTYSTVMRGLISANGMFQAAAGQHDNFTSLNNWLQTGLTPSFRVAFNYMSGINGSFYAFNGFAFEMYDYLFDT